MSQQRKIMNNNKKYPFNFHDLVPSLFLPSFDLPIPPTSHRQPNQPTRSAPTPSAPDK